MAGSMYLRYVEVVHGSTIELDGEERRDSSAMIILHKDSNCKQKIHATHEY